MNNYAFFSSIVQAIARDAAIAAHCRAHYGRGLAVYADVSSAGLPAAEQMPYALVHTPGVEKHQERREQHYAVAVDLAVNKDALAGAADPNVEQPAGVELIFELADLVVNAVRAALPADTAMGYTLAADTLGALPEVHAYLDLDFTTKITIAGDPLG